MIVQAIIRPSVGWGVSGEEDKVVVGGGGRSGKRR